MRCQQIEVYAAERDLPRGMTFVSARDAQAYVDALMSTWWYQRFYWNGPSRVEVYFRSRGNSTNKMDKDKDAGLIELTIGQRDEKTILHELAHILADWLNASNAHDPFFARTYAVLVYGALGSQAWLTLQRGFDACGIDYMK